MYKDVVNSRCIAHEVATLGLNNNNKLTIIDQDLYEGQQIQLGHYMKIDTINREYSEVLCADCDDYFYRVGCVSPSGFSVMNLVLSFGGSLNQAKDLVQVFDDSDLVNGKDADGDTPALPPAEIQREGKCMPCVVCRPGYFLSDCSVNYGSGTCIPCIRNCASDEYLLHPADPRGCNSDVNDGVVMYMRRLDYSCAQCLVSVQTKED